MVNNGASGMIDDFPVVCVGGSAGGLDAYTHLLRHLPADLGAAVVIVNHLRVVDTLLHEILPRYRGRPNIRAVSRKVAGSSSPERAAAPPS